MHVPDDLHKEFMLEKKEQNLFDDNLINTTKNINTIKYGFMWYNTYTNYGLTVSDYKIIYTNNNLEEILAQINDYIMQRIENNYYNTYLFYEAQYADLVSYNIMRSSNYPQVKLKLYSKYNKNLFDLKGDIILRTLLYNNLIYFKQYNEYIAILNTMNKKQLQKINTEVYGKYNVIHTKNILYKKLLDNKKREFIKNY